MQHLKMVKIIFFSRDFRVTGKICSGPLRPPPPPSEKETDQNEILELGSHNSLVQNDMCPTFFPKFTPPYSLLKCEHFKYTEWKNTEAVTVKFLLYGYFNLVMNLWENHSGFCKITHFMKLYSFNFYFKSIKLSKNDLIMFSKQLC